jgi:hypothetical protein
MSPTPRPVRLPDQLQADVAALRQSLRTVSSKDPDALGTCITAAQELAARALSLYLQHQRPTARPSGALLRGLDRLAQITKLAQDVTAALTSALARHAENQRREAGPGPVIYIGPYPWQHVQAAAGLLQRFPALCAQADHWLTASANQHHALRATGS